MTAGLSTVTAEEGCEPRSELGSEVWESPRPLRVLHLESNPHDAARVRAALEQGGLVSDITRIETRDAYLAALDRNEIDLILAEDTPSLDGVTALRFARERRPQVPFLFVSDISGEEVAVERLKGGARDYVLKQRLYRLPFAVRRALKEAEARNQRQHAEQRIRRLNSQLEAANRKAERANEAKREFLSRMSHDLRTPLNAIMAFAQLLDTDPLAPDQHNQLQHILAAGHHLLDLINETLDIARIEAGQLPVASQSVPVGELVSQAIGLVRPLAMQREVILVDNSDECDELYVIADRRRLMQVLLNLLSNAIKYNRRGGGVTVTCVPTTAGRLRLNVTDNGPGLNPEKVQRLFRPFERLGADQQGDLEGTGLGLALSKDLAEAMGGTMSVISEVGLGSTFWIELPESARPANGETVLRMPPPVPTVVARKGKVLYIDDDHVNIRLMQRVCQQRPGVVLIGSEDGWGSLEVARNTLPDLILLDLQLHDVNGEDVLRELHNDERTRDIPVVVLSGDATPARIERLRQAGAVSYLTKPFHIQQVLQVLDTMLCGQSAWEH